MRPDTLKPFRIFAFAAVAAAFWACGRGEKSESAAEGKSEAPAAAAVSGSVRITGNDQMQYSLTAFEVQAGQPVTVVLSNVGSMPKEAMGHNFVLLQSGTAVPDFAQKAMAAKDNDYIPKPAPEVLAHIRVLGPGETDSVTFTAPPAGQYPFLCSFPGHFAVMQGVMTSK